MKENDIRPADLFAEYLRLSADDLERHFSDKATFIHRNCPGCGADATVPAFVKNGFNLVRCADCESLYANPCPSEAQLSEFYSNSISQRFWANTFFPAVAEVRRQKIFQPRADKIKKLLEGFTTEPGAIIDVGAGSGIMLEELKKAGVDGDFMAVEPTPELAESCRAKGIETFEGFANDAAKNTAFGGSATLVISFEVVEHVISPRNFLESLAVLARPGGMILFTGLCGSGFDIQALGEYSNSVSPPHHLNFLSRRGVSGLIRRAGLEEVSFETPGVLDVDIVRNTYAANPQSLIDPFLRHLFDQSDEKTLNAFQEFITTNKLSSHMWVLARKPDESKESI